MNKNLVEMFYFCRVWLIINIRFDEKESKGLVNFLSILRAPYCDGFVHGNCLKLYYAIDTKFCCNIW